MNHPDEPLPEEREQPAPNAQEQELAEAMAASLNELKAPEKSDSSSAATSESIQVLDLVKGAVSVVERSPVSAFSVSTFIMTLCNRNDGADRKRVIEWFVASLDETVASASSLGDITTKMNAISHLLTIMMSESVPCRKLAVEEMMIPSLMKTLDQWGARYTPPEEIPMWIEGLLLVLDFLSQTQHRVEDDSSDNASSHSSGSEMAEEREKTPLELILSKWSPAGAIKEEQRTHLVEFCIKVLQHLHSYGSVWELPETTTPQEHLTAADPADVTQAVIQLLASITRCHQTALKVISFSPCERPLGPKTASVVPSQGRSGSLVDASCIVCHAATRLLYLIHSEAHFGRRRDAPGVDGVRDQERLFHSEAAHDATADVRLGEDAAEDLPAENVAHGLSFPERLQQGGDEFVHLG